MFRYLPLIVKNCWRNRRRTTLTIVSIGVSMCLLGVLIAVYHALYLRDATPDQARRLVTRNRISLTVPIPLFYREAGRHFTCATPDRSAFQFAQVIRQLVSAYPFAKIIHLVMDNLNIHCRKSLTDHLGEREGNYLWNRLKVHHTPKHGSWLNQAEIELSLISRQCLGTRRIPDLA